MNSYLVLLTIALSINNHEENVENKDEVKTENQSDQKTTNHEHSEKFSYNLNHNSQEKIPRT